MLLRLLLAASFVAVTVAAGGAPAVAHAPAVAADTLLAQTIGGMELTLAIRRATEVPGPLRVDVIPHVPVRALPIEVTVRSATSTAVATGSARLERDAARTYPVALTVGESGPHWLELRAGDEFSQLPFQVLLPRASAAQLWTSGALAAAALLLIGALAAAGLGPRRIALPLGGAGGMALVVAATLAVAPPADPAGAAEPAGRPYVQARFTAVPAGADLLLRFTLLDSSTGRPVDDLVPHHQALAHAVVSSVDGASLHHLHPRRTAAGQLEMRLRGARPGPYRVDVEFEREDSGGQLVSGRFEVAGAARTEAETPATLPTTPGRVVAGRPVQIEIDTGPGRVQPWLGMAGHLIVRTERGDFLGHAHEQASMAAGGAVPDDTVAAFEPRLRFAFTFPEPGRYFVWLQYARDLRIVTVPYVVEVAP
ncbi:hypothetical protein [Catenuloplanes atrovinosus]|uniref:Secreted protein n=1 Tax=Catenuloplanes atrovinosus TaxID=137266 RepID=A0AAE4CB20_9ACTN|nr:hypothetical protein [Catenuloplanes atrovinosus]MDR7276404.1 hypothetical protein [Catenuloplanes atrovinosus]